MSIENEINNFEFESITEESSNLIKKGFNDVYKDISEDDDLEEICLNNLDLISISLENIVDKDMSYPETFIEVLDIFENCKDILDSDSLSILRIKKYNQLSSYYITNPLLVSIIEVVYKNIDESVELEDLFVELLDLTEIVLEKIQLTRLG